MPFFSTLKFLNYEIFNFFVAHTHTHITDKNKNSFSKYKANDNLSVLFKFTGLLRSKALGGSNIDSPFHHSEVDQMCTRNFWDLSGKK